MFHSPFYDSVWDRSGIFMLMNVFPPFLFFTRTAVSRFFVEIFSEKLALLALVGSN